MRDERPNSRRPAAQPGDYLRQVRHIRIQFADKPAEMQRRLKLLAEARDREVAATDGTPRARHSPTNAPNPFAYTSAAPREQPRTSPRKVLGVSSEVAELFAVEVEAVIESGLLRFTERRKLIARAQRLGMSRFDANLVIASVLHTQPATLNAPMIRSARGLRFSSTVAAFLAIEAAVLAAAVWMLCH